MFDIGFWELAMIALVALVVVGPERLPKLVRVAGLWLGRANASVQSVRSEIARELRAEELRQALNETIGDVPNLNKIIDVESQVMRKAKPTAELKTESKVDPAADTEPKVEASAAAKKDKDEIG